MTEYAVDHLANIDEKNVPRAHSERMRLVAGHVRDFVYDYRRDNPDINKLSFSAFVRIIRLKYGIGDVSIRRMMRSDYQLTIMNDRVAAVE